ncbi:uncharacterized protein LOC124195538 [Daphnia pulex]|uniref:uncharacterized protein LOC124195538 n=1 Tax=Daphnia pulex TaxID=6669 RepID=UPI001EDDADA0|nr:uncharacterized protein LOC124195538 [Daphnia pulex]XP_046445942.1 uncharacterized protein LOC124195538 [Daphnia pulex]XP_046445943.1 uncharacterized protein LOC124195538 [Daphnia pulex]XP_046445944.1 uncharacterized protein LOC124195538 [Daphnia pulex]
MRWSVVKVLLALFILVSGFGMQMVSSASLPQQNDAPTEFDNENSQLVEESDMDYNGVESKLPLSVGVSDSGATRKYTHGHGLVVYPSLESSFGSNNHYVGHHNGLPNLIKGSSDCPILSDGQQHATITPSITSSPALIGETSVPVVLFPTADQGELDSTFSDVLSQLQTNIGLVSTGGLIDDLNFVDKDTDVVIVKPPPQVEAVEAEPEVLVDSPVVSNLANILFTSPSSSSSSTSSSSSSSSDSISSGGITGGDISSTSIANPFALFLSFALVVVGIFVLSLPIWIPFVIAKRRRSHGPFRKKTLALAGIKTHGNSVPHYLPNQVKLPYRKYKAGPALPQPEYHSTTIEDYYRLSGNPNYSYNMDLNVKPYSALFGNLFPSYSNQFSDPGPMKSKDLYGPLSNFFLKARRRNSYVKIEKKR